MNPSHRKTISELLSYRLSRIAGTLSRSASVRYRREFDVSLGEWRVIALLGEKPGTTLNRLARRAALDKSQMSRVVARLEARGYVMRSAGARRSTMLTLTNDGLALYEGLIGAANQRDQRLESLTSPAKMRVFEEVLDALDALSRQMEAEEDTQ